MSPETLAHTIQQHIIDATKIPSTIGIGPNMVMAKMALDLDSKRMSSGIARWTHDDLEQGCGQSPHCQKYGALDDKWNVVCSR